MTELYDYDFKLSNGATRPMSDYQGKVLLIVNTASKCGLTPQFKGLEKLYQKYADQGFAVIGFPCNQFANQDPGSNESIVEFCQLNYGVSFDMAEKIDVNGKDTAPLFKYLKSEAPGLMGLNQIKWNFTKFLVNQQGEVVERFAPATKPEDIDKAIEKLLAA